MVSRLFVDKVARVSDRYDLADSFMEELLPI